MEKCANCDAVIGELETPHVWRGEVVCETCHLRLSMRRAIVKSEPQPVLNKTPTASDATMWGILKAGAVVLLTLFILAALAFAFYKRSEAGDRYLTEHTDDWKESQKIVAEQQRAMDTSAAIKRDGEAANAEFEAEIYNHDHP
jgi:hypothetical protein